MIKTEPSVMEEKQKLPELLECTSNGEQHFQNCDISLKFPETPPSFELDPGEQELLWNNRLAALHSLGEAKGEKCSIPIQLLPRASRKLHNWIDGLYRCGHMKEHSTITLVFDCSPVRQTSLTLDIGEKFQGRFPSFLHTQESVANSKFCSLFLEIYRVCKTAENSSVDLWASVTKQCKLFRWGGNDTGKWNWSRTVSHEKIHL